MMIQETFIGAWIFPFGNIVYTNEDVSHTKSLSKYASFLETEAKEISWTSEERQKFLNSDIAYIAFKLGCIRLTKFGNQVGIQVLSTKELTDSLCYVIQAARAIGINKSDQLNIVIEEVRSSFGKHWIQFNSLKEVLEAYE